MRTIFVLVIISILFNKVCNFILYILKLVVSLDKFYSLCNSKVSVYRVIIVT
jgi:hypothetical protein